MYRKATQSRRNLIPILSRTPISLRRNPCPEVHQVAGEPVQDCALEPAEVPVPGVRDALAAPELVPETAIHPVRMRVQVAVRERQVLTAVLVRAAVQADAADALVGAEVDALADAAAAAAAHVTKRVAETAIQDAQDAKAVKECVKANARVAVDRHAAQPAMDVRAVQETAAADVLAAAHPAQVVPDLALEAAQAVVPAAVMVVRALAVVGVPEDVHPPAQKPAGLDVRAPVKVAPEAVPAVALEAVDQAVRVIVIRIAKTAVRKPAAQPAIQPVRGSVSEASVQ